MPAHDIQWNYGVAISGLTFQLYTNSGTTAIYPNAANLSGVISLNGSQAVAALGAVISGVASSRFYSIATISAVNMTCYTWCVLITSNSGCQPTTIHGINLSGPYAYATDCSGNDKLLTNVSAIPGVLAAASGPVVLRAITHTNALVGLWGSTHTSSKIDVVQVMNSAYIPTTLYTNDMSSIAGQVWNSLTATYTSSTTMGGKSVSVDNSSIASQVWNSLTTTYTSSPTFGGAVMLSGELATVSGLSEILLATSGKDKILTAISGLKNDVSGLPGATANTSTIIGYTSGLALKADVSSLPALYVSNSGHALRMDVSALAGTYTAVSGFDKILSAVSGVAVAAGSSVAGIQTTDATVLASGTLPHDVRMVRHFTWNDMAIDKRYTPVRQYHWNGTNNSSYFDISDDSDTTNRARGG